jgi:hypothetical protein
MSVILLCLVGSRTLGEVERARVRHAGHPAPPVSGHYGRPIVPYTRVNVVYTHVSSDYMHVSSDYTHVSDDYAHVIVT